MVKKYIFFVLCTLFFFPVLGQDHYTDSRTSAYVSRYDVWSPWGNASTLAYARKFEITASFQNKFALKELSTMAIQSAVATKYINVGAAFSHYGISAYNEMLVSLGVSRTIGKRFALAVQANYFSVHYSTDARRRGKFFSQIGLMVTPTDNFYIGFQTINPEQSVITADGVKFKIPSIFALGISYWFTPRVVTSAQVEKDMFSDLRFAVEVDYLVYEPFRIKVACVKRGEIMPAIGCGLTWDNVCVDANVKINTKIGVIPSIALTYRLK